MPKKDGVARLKAQMSFQQFGLDQQVGGVASKYDFAFDQNDVVIRDLRDMPPVFVDDHAADAALADQ